MKEWEKKVIKKDIETDKQKERCAVQGERE